MPNDKFPFPVLSFIFGVKSVSFIHNLSLLFEHFHLTICILNITFLLSRYIFKWSFYILN